MFQGPFHDMLSGLDLQMQEATFWCHPDPRWHNSAMFQKGSSLGKHPIDGVWVTPDLPLETTTWLRFLLHLGDHRFHIMDINAKALVGEHLLKIVWPPAHRLVCSVPVAMSKYLNHLKSHLEHHKVLPRLHQLYSAWDSNFTPAQWAELESLDTVRAEGMRFTEKKCWKLAMGSVDFSPEVNLARHCQWVWQQVVKIREGKRVSASLVKWKARQCGITCLLSMSLAQAKEWFATANKEFQNLKSDAP
jgi:hypothetical protein